MKTSVRFVVSSRTNSPKKIIFVQDSILLYTQKALL